MKRREQAVADANIGGQEWAYSAESRFARLSHANALDLWLTGFAAMGVRTPERVTLRTTTEEARTA